MNQDKPIIALIMTSDLHFDQRMTRILFFLHDEYAVVTVSPYPFVSILPNHTHIKIRTISKKGILFYLFFNLFAFCRLLVLRPLIIYTADMDTALVGNFMKQILGSIWVLDLHEYFSEMAEIKNKDWVRSFWRRLENNLISKANLAITVCNPLAYLFTKLYKRDFLTIYNYSSFKLDKPKDFLKPFINTENSKIVLYQGALNEGRGLEKLIENWHLLPRDLVLHLVGDGTIKKMLLDKVLKLGLETRIIFFERMLPTDLYRKTKEAWLGLNLIENDSLNAFYSLANKYFDYASAGIPQITNSYPCYIELNKSLEVACLLNHYNENPIDAILKLKGDIEYYNRLKINAIRSPELWNPDFEKQKLKHSLNKLLNLK